MSKPSPIRGGRMAITLWRLVLAVFIVSVVVAVPVQLIVWAATGETLAAMPADGLPTGELGLVLAECLLPVWAPLLLAVLTARLGLWVWTVLWHTGVVRWFHYSGRRDVRLAELLSRGLMGWWRWARLGLTALVLLVAVEAGLAATYSALKGRAIDAADDWALGIYFETAVILGLLAVVVCWLATLRGAWILGDVNRKSAVLAWLAGLWGTVTQPIRSLLTLLAWAVPGTVAAFLPLAAGWWVEPLRSPAANSLVGFAAGLLASFCWVALFCSFAPVMERPRGDNENGRA